MIDESNRTAETIRDQLLSFGVEPAKAHAASVRYSTIEAAANWVFGDGENVGAAHMLRELTHSGSLKRTKSSQPRRLH